MNTDLEVIQPAATNEDAPALFAAPQQQQSTALAAISNNAEVTKELASIYIAQQFPRNFAAVTAEMQAACSRLSLAQQAVYTFPRGGASVSGPSIRLAEALLSAWGNAESGWKEVSRRHDPKKNCTVSDCEAFAFDKQRNLRATVSFSVPHLRDTKQGPKELRDERDIYELCANMSARRRRACILQILPAWLKEEALVLVNDTLAKGDAKKPLPDLIRSMEAKFLTLGITKEQLEQNLGHPLPTTTRPELVKLGQIYTSISDGMLRAADVFPPAAVAPAALKPKKATAPEADAIPGIGTPAN